MALACNFLSMVSFSFVFLGNTERTLYLKTTTRSLKSTFISQVFCFQDDSSPAALTDLCLTYVSQNLEHFCVKLSDGSWCFKEAVLFPQELADQLLAKMATEGNPDLFKLKKDQKLSNQELGQNNLQFLNRCKQKLTLFYKS